MTQASSLSQSAPDRQQLNGHAPQQTTQSAGNVSIDLLVAQSNPTYHPPYNYSSHLPQQGVHQYAAYAMYARPEWVMGQQGQPTQYDHLPVSVGDAAQANIAQTIPCPPTGDLISPIPIRIVRQHKCPRQRCEETERMYKCGWNGCEKTYGTLNHLNGHVTMQSHGAKRTSEEYREARYKWKMKRKEMEHQRRQEEHKQHQDV